MDTPLLIMIASVAIALVLLAAGSLRWRKLSSQESRIILTGGGTGGHVNPAIAIAESIRRREPDASFLYVGVRGKAEEVIVNRAGYPLKFALFIGRTVFAFHMMRR